MKIRLQDIKLKAETRPDKYYEDVVSNGTVKGEFLEITTENYLKLTEKYRPNPNVNLPKTYKIGGCSGCGSRPSGSFPPLMTQAKNVVGAASRVVNAAFTGQKIKASPEKVKERQTVCDGCEFKKDNRCTVCGCYWKVKILLESERCPKGFW